MAAARSNAESPAHAGHAACAAKIARPASARVPSGTVPITSPVDGLVASNVAPSSASTHSPPIHIRTCSLTSAPPNARGRPPRAAPASTSNARSGRRQPGLPDVLVRVHPFLRGLLGLRAFLDRECDAVLVFRRPLK